jgi:molybdopterin-guanine dinucleotide biosynthesis protein A
MAGKGTSLQYDGLNDSPQWFKERFGVHITSILVCVLHCDSVLFLVPCDTVVFGQVLIERISSKLEIVPLASETLSSVLVWKCSQRASY